MISITEDISDFLLSSSLTLVVVFLSLTLISYGLKMKSLTILCLVLLMISGVVAIMTF